MKKFVVQDDFWAVFPNTKIGIIVCNGIDNTTMDEEKYRKLLAGAEKEALKHLQNDEFSKNKVISVWRDAFQKFKTKKGGRSSIEALLKRVKSGKGVGTINPLVDIYNSISLKYALPCGGEDIDTFEGDVRLTKAVGDEEFVTLGTDISAPPYEGEIVYKDDAGAICRCWNWRESVRTMITDKTTNAFMCLELIDEGRVEDFNNALNELSELMETHLGGTCKLSVLTVDNKEIMIG